MDRRVELVAAIMRDNLHLKLPLRKLACSLGLSQSRLHRLFKRETGTTPARYFHRLKLERARELFDSTTMSVKEVINSVGIEDRSHFDREFKRVYSTTPAPVQDGHPDRPRGEGNADRVGSRIRHKTAESAIRIVLITQAHLR